MGKVYLYGAGGHAKVIADILEEHNLIVPEIYDDNEALVELIGIPVVHHKEIASPLIVSIGNNEIRKKIVDNLKDVIYTRAIAHTAVVSETVHIGQGSVIMQGAIVQSSVNVGKHTIINTGATVDHDCIIHDFVHIAPGCNLCGNVEVGEGSFIGAGSIIIPGVKIGKWAVIGAGSVVRKNIPDNIMAVGNPCKIYKTVNNE
ncbi:acetyltransferase [Dysgonomonas sp. 511]|uniref:acetyltransferase n=1 Tax=Dysgonomonas sp. 511 TaxID=2302930 RepID=UPI0013D3E936|nr:acetyltransferase [Dysgonomonas sp. 511]NDV78850.1 acetyltransferase [Dysgonomonas sp. 511]